MERYALAQLILRRQHAELQSRARELGLRLYGDVQVGLSPRDAWSRQGLLLRGYRLGAPPSRTNPQGQAWGHGVLDPAQYLAADGGPGPALRFVLERIARLLEEFDGLRIDHPHGWVCPWVYRSDDPDALHAVQHGARLFSSPDLADHPRLAAYSIVRPEQIERSRARHADDWVRELEPAQVDRYAVLVDALVDQMRAHGRDEDDILCEVLSTQPYPLARVMARHGLGRFRVTQKARLDDPADVYRSENALPADWVMVGNHDTASIWRLARQWQGTAVGRAQAQYLAQRLSPGGGSGLVEELAADWRKLAHAKFADLFLSPARHVMIFFADLLGLEENYNVPGTVSDENWSLRVPPDYRRLYPERCLRGEALNLPAVLALALRARGGSGTAEAELLARLQSLAGAWMVGRQGSAGEPAEARTRIAGRSEVAAAPARAVAEPPGGE
jgi:4-alpha-glucanotransferase